MRGPLAPFRALYKEKLEQVGYTPLSVVNELRQLAHLSRWLEGRGMGVEGLGRDVIAQFLAVRRVTVGAKASSSLSLSLLLEVLRGAGAVEEEPVAPEASGAEALLASFRHYLLTERATSAQTADAYLLRARRFLAVNAPDGDLAGLRAGDVTGAVLAESARVSVGGVQMLVAALRAFLRFCFLEGLVEVDLSAAALAMTGRRRSSLPRGVTASQAAALVRSCDRRTAMGRRDYAVILVLSRLGLRASEVAALTLDDVDWRAGDVVVHGKASSVERLPLPADVGEALAAYLARGRPRSPRREVFLRLEAPVAGLGRGGISFIVRRACRRAGIAPFGAHRLRHGLACQMVAAGVPVPQIGAVLRHRSVISTANYARVDIERLRVVALPWPGGEAP
ncbi:MAG: tyrosine-type recombinase/integrase [Actinomycetota bacterium]|nr:tyrosine-type recombinase/integrase [Actinomycetota bacterium]